MSSLACDDADSSVGEGINNDTFSPFSTLLSTFSIHCLSRNIPYVNDPGYSHPESAAPSYPCPPQALRTARDTVSACTISAQLT
jgi:hypothetical protein